MPYGEPNDQPGERTFFPFEDVVLLISIWKHGVEK